MENEKILTTREKEVLKLVMKGCGNREIGKELMISEHTAHAHVASILRKLGAKNRTQACVIAMKDEGLQALADDEMK